MSGTPNRAYGPADKPRRSKAMTQFSLSVARAMLPLIKRILHDIVEARGQIDRWQPELDNLERHRRDLSWPERQRRYRLEEETVVARRRLSEASDELAALGVELVDAAGGEVAFPTRVNGREAVYCWLNSDDAISSWRYANESLRRPLPDEGLSGSSLRFTSNR
jgi:hypothetical protein